MCIRDSCSITPRISTTNPTFFYHSNIRDIIILSQIISSCEPMASTTHDYYLIFLLWLSFCPSLFPAQIISKGFCKNGRKRVSFQILFPLNNPCLASTKNIYQRLRLLRTTPWTRNKYVLFNSTICYNPYKLVFIL